jgi:hypothetical protein
MQDPRFTELDRQFLKSLDCQVVDDPEAFQHINDNSFVYAIHCPIRLLWKVKESSYPALLICNDIRNMSNAILESVPNASDHSRKEIGLSGERVQDVPLEKKTNAEYYEETLLLTRGCNETAFPQLKYDFSETMIYWRHLQKQVNPEDAVMIENL